jgi:hypothetical protein
MGKHDANLGVSGKKLAWKRSTSVFFASSYLSIVSWMQNGIYVAELL